MIAAITEQGEGRDAEAGPVPVDDKYVPSEEGMKVDYNADDAEVRHLWDQLGHYERFQQVALWLSEIVTWPQWWEARGGKNAWTWQDLVTDPDPAHVYLATQQFAEQRAAALNDPKTAGEINDALNQSYSSLLLAIEESWKDARWRNRQGTDIDADDLFPYAAMQALYTRVAAVWAAHGVPQWKKVDTTGGLPTPGARPTPARGWRRTTRARTPAPTRSSTPAPAPTAARLRGAAATPTRPTTATRASTRKPPAAAAARRSRWPRSSTRAAA